MICILITRTKAAGVWGEEFPNSMIRVPNKEQSITEALSMCNAF